MDRIVTRGTNGNHVRAIMRTVDCPLFDMVGLRSSVRATGIGAFSTRFRDQVVSNVLGDFGALRHLSFLGQIFSDSSDGSGMSTHLVSPDEDLAEFRRSQGCVKPCRLKSRRSDKLFAD